MRAKDTIFRLMLVYVLGALIIILLALLSQSCTTTKTVQKESIKSERETILEDSVRVLTKEVEQLLQEKRSNEYGVIRFDTVFIPGDTVINTVVIKDGNIEAKGRIKYVEVNKSVYEKLLVQKDKIIDSLSKLKQKEVVKTEVKTVDKVKKVSFIPWWVWLIVGVLLPFSIRDQIKKLF